MIHNTKYVFFGTGDFAVKILEILIQNNFIPDLVITTPDKPKGRKMQLQPTPVKLLAQKNNISFISDYSRLTTDYYDLFIVSDYGKIIPKEILEIPRHGSLNIHPSLLPKFRGSSPIQSFILSGEEETGITIIKMTERVDAGPIIAQQQLQDTRYKIQDTNYKDLEEKLAELGGELLVKTIPEWIEGKIKPTVQDESQATYTKKIAKENGLVDLEKDPPEIIERKVRAFTPWPSAYFFVNNPPATPERSDGGRGKRIIITEAELENGKLIIKKIKPEGKNEMSFDDFLRGNSDLSENI